MSPRTDNVLESKTDMAALGEVRSCSENGLEYALLLRHGGSCTDIPVISLTDLQVAIGRCGEHW
jgi:hypothetical protein